MDLGTIIIPIATAVIGWTLRHFHVGMPAPKPATPSTPASPAAPGSVPTGPSVLGGLLAQLEPKLQAQLDAMIEAWLSQVATSLSTPAPVQPVAPAAPVVAK